ncbi:MAG: diacylglycerol kinase [Ignavibacteriaceae bacterium]|nr:diacylglycerol kinase [Ignavibacteriaceae bacterium]
MRTLLIVNPYSRNGRSGKLTRRAMNYLTSKGCSFDYAEVKEFDDAYKLSVKANREGIENIIAVGGDGTINKVLNGFYDEQGRRVSGSRFGVIHTGTSPDFCKSYGIPLGIEEAAAAVISESRREIPIGKIELKSSPGDSSAGNTSVRYFACCANIGLGAKLARAAGGGIRKYLGDAFGTFVSLAGILATYRGTGYEVNTENGNTTPEKVFNISVGITNYIASGLKVYRDPAIADNMFYMMTVAGINLSNAGAMLKKVYAGKPFTNTAYLHLDYTGYAEITTESANDEVEFDGDPAGHLPCRIEMAKEKLTLLTGRKGNDGAE